MFADADIQKEELRKMIHSLVRVRNASADWGQIRHALLWQRSWHNVGDEDGNPPIQPDALIVGHVRSMALAFLQP